MSDLFNVIEIYKQIKMAYNYNSFVYIYLVKIIKSYLKLKCMFTFKKHCREKKSQWPGISCSGGGGRGGDLDSLRSTRE